MSNRALRRAAERQSRKQAQKQSREQTLVAAVGADSAQPISNPPSTIQNHDSQNTAPLPQHLLNATEDADIPNGQDYSVRSLSQAQLDANRANAKLSSGPATEDGKAISSRNNFRHGLNQHEGDLILVEDESEEEYLASLAGFMDEWKPATATEHDLVVRLAGNQWLRRRALRLQKTYLSPYDGHIEDDYNFALYRRYELSQQRAFNKALSDLIRVRSLHQREKNGFESQQRKAEEHEYKIRRLQARETLQNIAVKTAECKLQLLERRLAAQPAPTGPKNKPKAEQNAAFPSESGLKTPTLD